jgi:hypothetical protein
MLVYITVHMSETSSTLSDMTPQHAHVARKFSLEIGLRFACLADWNIHTEYCISTVEYTYRLRILSFLWLVVETLVAGVWCRRRDSG